jgi:hypothetical protein
MPQTTNQFVIQVPTGGVDKLDLLFMIDNSQSMGDKQALLRDAVPSLLMRFVQPLCLDEQGAVTAESSVGGKCSRGAPEFPPVEDIHIAVISSSLGAFGSSACSDDVDDDRAWLLPLARSGLPSWNNSGFLAWDPGGKGNTPPGTKDPAELTGAFSNLVAAVGETGCGYEASLESWHRFLIDPNPPESVRIEAEGRYTEAVGTDTALLAQRKAFLRPDSLVAIVMLSDENDCSFVSNGQAHFLTRLDAPGVRPGTLAWRMYRATSACETNPNDPCCRSCATAEADTPTGCIKLADDPSCQRAKPEDGPRQYEELDDSVNLRCYDQKRRFGFDSLEPVGKYIRALTQPTVLDRDGREQPNPLFAPSPMGIRRDPGLVYLAGIVGVPWQDIASDDSLQGPGLRYLTAEELVEKQRWDLILGDPAQRRPPSDPHMVESVRPRSGSHPLRIPGADIAPSTATSPRADVISGHEYEPHKRGDLQYACIYERETPEDCSTKGCDCKDNAVPTNTPLCQAPAGTAAVATTQYFAKAYPSTRQLEVLRGVGKQGIVASICAKLARGPTSDPSYGYNPAVSALIDRLSGNLANQCLGRAPALTESGQSACMVVEARIDGQCDCSQPGRKPASADVLSSVRGKLKGSYCDLAGASSCSSVCACQLAEASAGAAMTACRSTTDPNLQAPAYCYVEPAAGLGDPKLVEGCPSSKQRLLRFVGPETPSPGSIAFMACMGVASQQGAL